MSVIGTILVGDKEFREIVKGRIRRFFNCGPKSYIRADCSPHRAKLPLVTPVVKVTALPPDMATNKEIMKKCDKKQIKASEEKRIDQRLQEGKEKDDE